MAKKMNFEEFQESVRDALQKRAENQNRQVMVEKIMKYGTQRTAIIIAESEGEKACPVFYLEGEYENYLKGRKLEEIIEGISIAYNKASDIDNDAINEILKPCNFYPRLENENVNLTGIPHIPFYGHQLFFVSEYKDMSATISLEMLKILGMSMEDLKKTAIENINKDFKLRNINYFLQMIAEEEEFIQEFIESGDTPELYIIETKSAGGAAIMASPEALATVADTLGEDFYFITDMYESLLVIGKKLGDDLDMKGYFHSLQYLPHELDKILYYYDSSKKQISIISR